MSTESIGSSCNASNISNKESDRSEDKSVEWKGRTVCEQDAQEDIQKPNFFYYQDPVSGVYHKLIAVQKSWLRKRCHFAAKGIRHAGSNVGHALKKGAVETGHFFKSAAHKTGEFIKKHDGGGGGVSMAGPSVPLGPHNPHPVPSQNQAPPRTASNPYKPKSAFSQNPTQTATLNPQDTPPIALPRERLIPGGPSPQGQFPHRVPHFGPGKGNHFEVKNPLVGQPSMQIGGSASNLPSLDPNQLLQNPNANPYTRGFDDGHILREAALQKAEIMAKQQRYSYLVHNESKITEAEGNLSTSLDKFKETLLKFVEAQDVEDAVLITGSIATAIAKSGGGSIKLIARAAAAAITAIRGSKLVGRMKIKYAELSKDLSNVELAYDHLEKLVNDNNKASYDKCLAEGYTPKLEFGIRENIKSNPSISVLIDKNDPNHKHIEVVLP